MYQKTNVTINWVSWENPRPVFHHKHKQCIFMSVHILTGNSVHITVQYSRSVAETSSDYRKCTINFSTIICAKWVHICYIGFYEATGGTQILSISKVPTLHFSNWKDLAETEKKKKNLLWRAKTLDQINNVFWLY